MARNSIDAISPFRTRKATREKIASAEEPMNSGRPRACPLGENQIIGLPPSVKRPTRSALDRPLASPSSRALLFPVSVPPPITQAPMATRL